MLQARLPTNISAKWIEEELGRYKRRMMMQPYVVDLIALAIIILGIAIGAARGLLLTLYSMVNSPTII